MSVIIIAEKCLSGAEVTDSGSTGCVLSVYRSVKVWYATKQEKRTREPPKTALQHLEPLSRI